MSLARLMSRTEPFFEGVSHATSQDDQYNGYFIPKGTTVVGNAWWAYNGCSDDITGC